MRTASMNEAPYRFGEYGPGYIMRGPRTDVGVVRLRPGDDAVNHYHSQLEETFYVIEGEATLWVDGRESFTVTVGDAYQLEPGEQHYFVNNSTADFRALFIKAPYDPDDGVQVDWTPGDPPPPLAPGRDDH